jgi:hypothetical protein
MGHDTVLKARTAPEGELLGLPFAAKMHPTWVVRVSHAFLDVNNAAVQYGDYWRGFLSMTTLEIRPRADIPELLRQTLDRKAQAQQRSGATKLRAGPSSRLRSRAGS